MFTKISKVDDKTIEAHWAEVPSKAVVKSPGMPAIPVHSQEILSPSFGEFGAQVVPMISTPIRKRKFGGISDFLSQIQESSWIWIIAALGLGLFLLRKKDWGD
jgi:hypothetical protein